MQFQEKISHFAIDAYEELEKKAHYRIYFFGQFQAFQGTTAIEETKWRRDKAKILLKWLILNKGKLFSADQLIERFWPDKPQDVAIKNLHVTIHYLRRMIEPNLAHPQKSRFVKRNAHNFYWLEVDNDWWIDTCAVQSIWEEAQRIDRLGDTIGAIEHYSAIVRYSKQGFLPEDIYEDCFRAFRQQYNHLIQQALSRLIQHYLQLRELEVVLKYSYQALSLNPYYEQAVQAIATVYFHQGNVAGALEILDTFQDTLKKELGFKPCQEFYTLRKNIKETRVIAKGSSSHS